MFRGKVKRFGAGLLLLTAAWVLGCPAWGQDSRKVPISFLPPPLETATYSLGIYDAKSGKLVRRLKEGTTQDAFTVGDNGLITSWDGKDDAGKAVAPGKYAARGYAVGALKVEGEAITDNDWTTDNENLRMRRVTAIALVPNDNGLVVLGELGPGAPAVVARYGGEKVAMLWHKTSLEPTSKSGVDLMDFSLHVQDGNVIVKSASQNSVYRLSDGAESSLGTAWPDNRDKTNVSQGKDSTTWKVEAGSLNQYSSGGERLRSLLAKPGEPVPLMVAASQTEDRLYLLEEAENLQRVRGLSWKETKQEGEKTVSTWETFFERSIHSVTTEEWADDSPDSATQIEIVLADNPLTPGKPRRLKVIATRGSDGGYLSTSNGLLLRRISERPNLLRTRLTKGKMPGTLLFFQSDGAATDEFSISGVRNIMEFDAGEFEMTADGEKTHTEKAAEPPDL